MQVNGYKVVMILPDGRGVKLRWENGPAKGRSIVFANGDDAMDCVTNAQTCFPQCQIVLRPTVDMPNVASPTEVSE